ncbi:MAG TPA: hypothetical protein VFZ89_09055 [Solirubrobacteraceae bacterium]
MRAKRLGLLIGMALCAVNIWTGGPLLALWIGSQIQGELTTLSMGAVFMVILVLALVVAGLTVLLGRLSATYNDLVGIKPRPREPAPWLRSMRGERSEYQPRHMQVSAVDRLLVGSVLLAALVFETWFFFFSGSSIG